MDAQRLAVARPLSDRDYKEQVVSGLASDCTGLENMLLRDHLQERETVPQHSLIPTPRRPSRCALSALAHSDSISKLVINFLGK